MSSSIICHMAMTYAKISSLILKGTAPSTVLRLVPEISNSLTLQPQARVIKDLQVEYHTKTNTPSINNFWKLPRPELKRQENAQDKDSNQKDTQKNKNTIVITRVEMDDGLPVMVSERVDKDTNQREIISKTPMLVLR